MRANLGQEVNRRMEELGLSQLELARACGLSQGHLSKILGGRPPGPRATRRLEEWLKGPKPVSEASAAEVQRLARLLKKHCDELANLCSRLQ